MCDSHLRILHLDHQLVLRGMEQLEKELYPYLQRLMSLSWRSPKEPNRAHFANRPGWWWRVRLIEWTGALTTRRSTDAEALHGFREFIRHCAEEEVCEVVRTLVEESRIQESA